MSSALFVLLVGGFGVLFRSDNATLGDRVATYNQPRLLQPSYLLSPTVLTNKALKRTRKNLFDAFLVAHHNSEQSNTSPGMRMVINHWRGCLDAYRVSLRLDGKREYPKAIQHGDIFLKIMWQECQPKRGTGKPVNG